MQIPPHEIAFDFDGVVADTFHLFVQLARDEYQIEVNYEEITTYEFLKAIHMEKTIADKLIDMLTDIPHELDLQPNKGAAQTLKKLARRSTLFFVTARAQDLPVRLWFNKTMPQLDGAMRIAAAGDYAAKLPILRQEGVRFFVEDRLDTCHLLAASGITPIVYDQPWNRAPHPFAVVHDWEEIDRMIAW